MSGLQLTPRIAVIGVAPECWAVALDGKTLVTMRTKKEALQVAHVIKREETK